MKIMLLFMVLVLVITLDFLGMRKVQIFRNFSMLNIQVRDPRTAQTVQNVTPSSILSALAIPDKAYLHCTLRICLPEENTPCPEICDHGTPDPNWFVDMGYQPLTLNVMGGPYFLASTNAVDLTRIREIDDEISPSDIALNNRFLNMFGDDGEVHNRESQDVQLPIWVPIVISVLAGFAMGLGKGHADF